ncbi:uncharacterized protein BCR38DRAFT_416721 [Pseudomassariella vexata]|uniref:Uncharacterized protein n=1 Tax=Pseudomassariella vexata TaxID=1141098 RepID=A0A1Y2EIY4_9PEZI|nr:uncharacterized protein BCR38DRAFT_416721 [Pseudomassariella vexata]ORY71407.1 hypothetical protein BCR38DRAFT_416721 [Pseudomassariella vexata]
MAGHVACRKRPVVVSRRPLDPNEPPMPAPSLPDPHKKTDRPPVMLISPSETLVTERER